MRNGTDPLLFGLASRECINVGCNCGRIVQLAAYQLIGRLRLPMTMTIHLDLVRRHSLQGIGWRSWPLV